MDTVSATTLKNRLGEVLARAALVPVAIERHGRVVAYLVPPATSTKPVHRRRKAKGSSDLGRLAEERLVRLCASGDYRPSRWLRAGDPWLLAGVATMLASVEEFDRNRLLGLAERLHPGMSKSEEFGRWLESAPVQAARLLPMVRSTMGRGEARPRA